MTKQTPVKPFSDNLFPLFGHQTAYPNNRSNSEKETDFVMWILANLAGASIKALANCTGHSEQERLGYLFDIAKERIFHHFAIAGNEDSGFTADRNKMDKFLDAIFIEGLLRMPREIREEIPSYDHVLEELGIIEHKPETEETETEETETEETEMLEQTEPTEVKRTTGKRKGRKAKTVGRPRGRLAEDTEVYWDKPIVVGEKEPINQQQADIQQALEGLIKRARKHPPTLQTLLDYLVEKDGWEYQPARQTLRRFIRRHLYLTYK